jgi:hypothetical protein
MGWGNHRMARHRRISEVQVQQTKQAIRRNLPHLATSDSPDMSTLEASVIAYYTHPKMKPSFQIALVTYEEYAPATI